MKEFIDKLIERLEEAKVSANRRNAFDSEVSYACAIDIVNKLAEEYKVSEMPIGSEDYCEWVLIDYEANVYDTTCRNPHILLEGSPTDNSYEFCPYCGKKIKVAPYTEGE
jgi:hypothetical protein